jgi:hypothetical protein
MDKDMKHKLPRLSMFVIAFICALREAKKTISLREIANNPKVKKQDGTPVSFQVCAGVSGDVSRSVRVC